MWFCIGKEKENGNEYCHYMNTKTKERVTLIKRSCGQYIVRIGREKVFSTGNEWCAKDVLLKIMNKDLVKL